MQSLDVKIQVWGSGVTLEGSAKERRVHPIALNVENMLVAQICAMLKTDTEHGLSEDASSSRSA